MMNGRLRSLWIPAAGAVLCFSLAAHAKLSRVAGPEVSFTLIGPAGMKIVGNGTELRVGDDGQAVKVAVPLASMKTGISIRDKHMHEKYLQTPNYPSAELQVPRAALKIPAAGGNVAQDAAGTLALHGKTRPVNLHYTSSREGSKLRVRGTMHINMNDFGIEVPSYLGVTVKPDVDIVAQFDVSDE
ncbi:MAG TPA: YceI family protein [Polyangiaceae bacterium]|nr:YceI family protein [Polyangiaceae bacterium]